MRPIATRSRRLAGVLLIALTLFGRPARAAEPGHFDDAALHAVQFWDQREGWAVGDAGGIWHSIDGGANWERLPSGTRASLRSLHFLSPHLGWVVGREELPHGGSTGVVLFTNDGGLSWRRILHNVLPGFNRVRFVDGRTGYLVGDGAEQYPAGVFATTDGGRTWEPMPGPRCPGWLSADFDRDGGDLAGSWNRQAILRKNGVHAVDSDILGGRSFRGVQLRGPGAVAVGQGGLVMLSAAGGPTRKWGQAKVNLPLDVLNAWDFHAVHGTGTHVWAVGRPGSVALHSADNGATWEVVRTGQTLPLNGLFFLNEKEGWAVGELGTVVVTKDGGRTWDVKKRGGHRAAALFVHARATSFPMDAVVALGGEAGYLTAGLCVTAADPATAAHARAAERDRARQAFRSAGGASAEALWSFPLSSHVAQAERADVLRAWDRLHGDRTAEQLLGQLVLAIRTWQPGVLLTDDAAASALDALVVEALREAFVRAGDPKAFPEQLSGLGLRPWKPSKLYGLSSTNAPGVVLDLTALVPSLGGSLRELASGPQGLLACAEVRPPTQRRYRLLADRLPGAAGHRDLMQGLALAPGGVARRAASASQEATPEMVRAARSRAMLMAMSEAPADKGGAPLVSPDRLLAQIGPMLSAMPDDQAARAAHAAACQFARAGQWNLAREAYLLLVDRYPTHPLTVEGYRWLVRHNSSSEARRRHDLGQFLLVQRLELGLPVETNKKAPPPAPPRKGQKGKAGPPVPEVQFEGRNRSQMELLGSKEDARKWYQSSLDLEPRLAAFGPLFSGDPTVQFCLQSARRNLGDFEKAKEWYRDFALRTADGPWRAAALAELWLMNRTGPPPKPVFQCKSTDTKPYLDGKLDDPCWERARAEKLQNAGGDTLTRYPTEVRMAHDKDFLYVAVRCTRPAGEKTEPAKVKARDGDLRKHDRVSILLDLDRDYSTCFHLQVDARGCVAEDCWGDPTWGPRWFVAVHHEETAWVVEAAIPMAALTGDIVTPGRAWAANVVRVLPGRGVQAWSLPAEVPEEALRPEGMGLLLFAAQETRQAAGPGR